MLKALSDLSAVGTQVIRQSKTAPSTACSALAPTLTKLAEAGDALPKALQVFLTYPFVDAVVGNNPAQARNLHMGDYTNLSVQLDLDLGGLSRWTRRSCQVVPELGKSSAATPSTRPDLREQARRRQLGTAAGPATTVCGKRAQAVPASAAGPDRADDRARQVPRSQATRRARPAATWQPGRGLRGPLPGQSRVPARRSRAPVPACRRSPACRCRRRRCPTAAGC